MSTMDVDDAFQFFGLDSSASEEAFNYRFHELALKYHPDKGEFNSSVIFVELMKHRHTLEIFYENKLIQKEPDKKATNDYTLYKEAKQIQNDSILKYFKEREKLNNKISPNADFEMQLKEELRIAKSKYLELIKSYPNSLWIRDAKDSIQSIEVWLK